MVKPSKSSSLVDTRVIYSGRQFLSEIRKSDFTSRMPTIYITSNGPTGVRYGTFPLQRDEQGPFVVLPGGKAGVKVRLDPAQIKESKGAFGADYFCERPVQYTQTENN